MGDWLARQLSQYCHLSEQHPERFAWVLPGRPVGRGPASEPLLGDVVPVARLSEGLLEEAEGRYHRAFRAGQGPES